MLCRSITPSGRQGREGSLGKNAGIAGGGRSAGRCRLRLSGLALLVKMLPIRQLYLAAGKGADWG